MESIKLLIHDNSITETEKEFFEVFDLGIKENFETRFLKISKNILLDCCRNITLNYNSTTEWKKWFNERYLKTHPYKNRTFFPKITDNILLKLICLVLNRLSFLECNGSFDINILKEKTLKMLISIQKDIKKEVKEIFE